MKKILSFLLALLLSAFLSGCTTPSEQNTSIGGALQNVDYVSSQYGMLKKTDYLSSKNNIAAVSDIDN